MGFMRQIGILTIIVLSMTGSVCAEESLRYAGATTLQRFFMPEVALIFTGDTAIKVHIKGGNTGPGIKSLLDGEVDMAGAGRRLTEQEKNDGLVEHFLGWDVLAIVVHEQNPLEDLTLDQLQGIFSGEITDWQEVGGKANPIVVVTSPKGSGMRSAVKKLILKDKDYLSKEIVSAIVAASDQHVSMFPIGITALSKSMIDADRVKKINVGGVAPTASNIANGRYPLAKPLVLVTKGEPQGDLARFVTLVKSPQGKAILQESFVPVE
ncbi:MAG: phosphate ABC transporter substrate-binding protein [Deltaproteobacteria bacterium]|nr:phosphate ABC transporter substrate-binding protein [Deltaproteobacteria bacterium]